MVPTLVTSDLQQNWSIKHRQAAEVYHQATFPVQCLNFPRKLMFCALAMSDATKACDIYHQMSASSQSAPSTLYLLYKVALRSHDLELGRHVPFLPAVRAASPDFDKAIESLDKICTASQKDATLLYACVLEAQQAGDQAQMVTSLQRVLVKYEYSAPDGVHLPALLRSVNQTLCYKIPSLM